MTSKFTEAQFDKADFLEIIKEFLETVDNARKKVDDAKKKGEKLSLGFPTNPFRDKMNPILKPLGYESNFNFGSSGNLPSGLWINQKGEHDKVCSMAFYRNDTIDKGFINQKEHGKLGMSIGIYIWLGYADQEKQEQIALVIGSGEKAE